MVMPLKSSVQALYRRRKRSIDKAHSADVHSLLDGEILRLIDVGAADGPIPRWYPYRRDLGFVGFEPDKRSSDALENSEQAREFQEYQIMPYAVWDEKGTIPISFTAKPQCSSYFLPAAEFLDRFPEPERYAVTGSGEIECHRLDEALSNRSSPADFIKLDMEGAELMALRGAVTVLRTCLGLQVEASFQYVRQEQPLFGDVAKFVETTGMEFMDFVDIHHWERSARRGIGQCIFVDALFLRAPENILRLVETDLLPPDKIKTYLAILLIYERYDLALMTLDLVLEKYVSRAYSERARALLKRRKQGFDRRVRMLSKLNRFVRFLSPDAQLDYRY